MTPRSRWALDVLLEEGYTYDASIFPIRHDRYGMPGAPRHPYVERTPAGTIAEAPATTVALGPMTMPAAGGGYFRIFPYAFTRWAIRRVNEQVPQLKRDETLHIWEHREHSRHWREIPRAQPGRRIAQRGLAVERALRLA